MIRSSSDFYFPDKNIFCEKEEHFKTMAETQFGFKVKQTLFEKGALTQHQLTQYHLHIWYEPIENTQFSDNGTYDPNEAEQQKIIKCYFDCFQMCIGDRSEIILNLLNYRKHLISYAYGHADLEVKNAIQKAYPGAEVLLAYGSDIFIVVIDRISPDMYDRVSDICYQLIKQFDYYNVITKQDVRIKIYKTGETPDLNGLRMANR